MVLKCPYLPSLPPLILCPRPSLTSSLPVKAGLRKMTSSRIPNVHALLLMTPISVFGAQTTPPLPSPDHSITICNQRPESAYPAHGASFVPVDWHQRTPDGRWVWECAHSHVPHCTHLSGLFPHLHSWASFFNDCETDLTSFPDIAAAAYLEYVGQPRPGVAAWHFPPHSLATNTLALLLKVFTTPAVLIEGFGAGCSFAAVAGHTCYPNTRRSSVLLSLGGVAMHPPTFSSLVDAYAFHHSQDAQKYHAYIDEERPDLNTRPADFQPTEKTELTYGFLIIQHIHDRKAPWTLSPLLLSHLHNKGISVLIPSMTMSRPNAKKPQKWTKTSSSPLPLGIIGIFTRMSCPLSKPSVPPLFSPISSAR